MMFLPAKAGMLAVSPLWVCAFLLSMCVALPAAFAQTDNPTSSVLKNAFDTAWAQSPVARGLQSKQDESKAALSAANSWVAGSPSLGLSQRFDQSSGTADVGFREIDLSLSAPVWWPGQKSARQSLASNSAAELDAQTTQARLELASQVREAYWQLALAQEDMFELEDHLKHLEDIANDVNKRVKAGDLARSDNLLANQEVEHAKAQLTAAKVEHKRRVTDYRNLTTLQAPVAFQPESTSQVSTQAATQVTIEHPRLQLSKATLVKVRAALDVANESRADNPSVGFSIRNERDDFSPNNRALGFHLQIPIGTDVQGKPLQATAKTQIAVAEAELKQLELAVVNEVELAKAQLDLEYEALGQATQRALSTTEYLALIEKAFRLGERGLNDLLRAQVLSHEATSAKTKQQLKVNLAMSRLNQAFGVFP